MSVKNLLKLLCLAAIWGASFMFMRLSIDDFGPVILIVLRCALGAIFLAVVCFYLKKSIDAKHHWKHYLILGLVNTALPFFLFGIAAQNISASVMSILNATAAIWAALIACVWSKTWPSPKSLLGLALGLCGVMVIVGLEATLMSHKTFIAILAGLGAAFCYGLASNYTRHVPTVDPMANALGSLIAATFWMMPFTLISPIHVQPDTIALVAAGVLGFVCSGLAYYLYFGLIEDIGAQSAMTVAFLIPVFGVLWGALILHEPIGIHTILGAVLILIAVALITGFSLKNIFASKPTP